MSRWRPHDQARLAVLVDADNAHAKHVDALVVEIAKHGTASVRRAYGDWTTNQLRPRMDSLLHHCVKPVQQFSCTSAPSAGSA
ncbi:NYN domain-containing protein [Demequina aestuarii]|uniref:NYN domain-containing protein n=1 Tax=Demequina aestuarii TaxID=327095 RepID=UPI000780D5E0|nr:NYN domain-containing protein [Demequina aestuarii]